jgi:hypothetical protein
LYESVQRLAILIEDCLFRQSPGSTSRYVVFLAVLLLHEQHNYGVPCSHFCETLDQQHYVRIAPKSCKKVEIVDTNSFMPGSEAQLSVRRVWWSLVKIFVDISCADFFLLQIG